MKINLAYLYDILAYMIEAQYLDGLVPKDYLQFIDHYLRIIDCQRDEDGRKKFREELKKVLKYILNNPHIDYNEIFMEGAMHGFNTKDEAQEVFELIWSAVIGDKDWHDDQFVNADLNIVNEPLN